MDGWWTDWSIGWMNDWMEGWWMDGRMDGFYAGYINGNKKVQLKLSIISFSWSFPSDFPPALHYKTTAKLHLLALRVSLSVALSTYWLSWSLKSAAHSDSNCVIIISLFSPNGNCQRCKKKRQQTRRTAGDCSCKCYSATLLIKDA